MTSAKCSVASGRRPKSVPRAFVLQLCGVFGVCSAFPTAPNQAWPDGQITQHLHLTFHEVLVARQHLPSEGRRPWWTTVQIFQATRNPLCPHCAGALAFLCACRLFCTAQLTSATTSWTRKDLKLLALSSLQSLQFQHGSANRRNARSQPRFIKVGTVVLDGVRADRWCANKKTTVTTFEYTDF